MIANLAHWSAQVALLVIVGAILVRLFQIQQPPVLAVWRGLLVLTLTLPVLQPWHKLALAGESRDVPLGTDVYALAPPSSVHSSWHVSIQEISWLCGAVILLGIAVRLTLLAIGLRKLRQFRERSTRISASTKTGELLEAMRKRVDCTAEFRLSEDVESPVTFGLREASILIPDEFLNMEPQLQSAIACHELLHVRRRDWAMHFVEETIRVAMWFHPAVLWLVAQGRLAREQVVDQQVLELTGARKPYLEALLRFATDRRRPSAVPAPPFLAERQLAQRVAAMLKEVRMSRRRLTISLAVIVVMVGAVAVSAVWMFPLKAVAKNAPVAGVAGGVTGDVIRGVTDGIVGGVVSGVVQGVGGSSAAVEPQVEKATIWVDEVKRGPLVIQVRGLGELVQDDSGKVVARISLPDEMTRGVHAEQSAMVDTRKGVVPGHVSAVGQITGAIRTVDIALDGTLPAGVGNGLAVDATVDVAKIDDVLSVGRPVHLVSGVSPVYKLTENGDEAVRVTVKFGRASAQKIEVVDGLKVGDRIILSDTSTYGGAEKIHLK
jgi:beta-lactamase regulating signal transducer with metallopeptidase domain